MPAGVSLVEIHNRLLFIDGLGNLVLNTKGNLAEQIAAGNIPTLVIPGSGTSVHISAAAGAANISDVTFQVQDGAGNNITGVFNFEVYLSDAATGAGLTATTASGTVTAASGGGVVRSTLTAKKDLLVQTNASGVFVLEITDTAKTHFYPVASMNGAVTVGTQLTTPNYG